MFFGECGLEYKLSDLSVLSKLTEKELDTLQKNLDKILLIS
jgi:hypothetical protein